MDYPIEVVPVEVPNRPAYKYRACTEAQAQEFERILTQEMRRQIYAGENYYDELINYGRMWSEVSNYPFTGSHFERMLVYLNFRRPFGVMLCFENPDEVAGLETVDILRCRYIKNGQMVLGYSITTIKNIGGEYKTKTYAFTDGGDPDNRVIENDIGHDVISLLIELCNFHRLE